MVQPKNEPLELGCSVSSTRKTPFLTKDAELTVEAVVGALSDCKQYQFELLANIEYVRSLLSENQHKQRLLFEAKLLRNPSLGAVLNSNDRRCIMLRRGRIMSDDYFLAHSEDDSASKESLSESAKKSAVIPPPMAVLVPPPVPPIPPPPLPLIPLIPADEQQSSFIPNPMNNALISGDLTIPPNPFHPSGLSNLPHQQHEHQQPSVSEFSAILSDLPQFTLAPFPPVSGPVLGSYIPASIGDTTTRITQVPPLYPSALATENDGSSLTSTKNSNTTEEEPTEEHAIDNVAPDLYLDRLRFPVGRDVTDGVFHVCNPFAKVESTLLLTAVSAQWIQQAKRLIMKDPRCRHIASDCHRLQSAMKQIESTPAFEMEFRNVLEYPPMVPGLLPIKDHCQRPSLFSEIAGFTKSTMLDRISIAATQHSSLLDSQGISMDGSISDLFRESIVIDWNWVSHYLNSNRVDDSFTFDPNILPYRSAHECYRYWQNTIRFNQCLWNGTREDTALWYCVQKHKARDWIAISEEFNQLILVNHRDDLDRYDLPRNPLQCCRRYQQSLNDTMLNNEWTVEDDLALIQAAMYKYGDRDYASLSTVLMNPKKQHNVYNRMRNGFNFEGLVIRGFPEYHINEQHQQQSVEDAEESANVGWVGYCSSGAEESGSQSITISDSTIELFAIRAANEELEYVSEECRIILAEMAARPMLKPVIDADSKELKNQWKLIMEELMDLCDEIDCDNEANDSVIKVENIRGYYDAHSEDYHSRQSVITIGSSSSSNNNRSSNVKIISKNTRCETKMKSEESNKMKSENTSDNKRVNQSDSLRTVFSSSSVSQIECIDLESITNTGHQTQWRLVAAMTKCKSKDQCKNQLKLMHKSRLPRMCSGLHISFNEQCLLDIHRRLKREEQSNEQSCSMLASLNIDEKSKDRYHIGYQRVSLWTVKNVSDLLNGLISNIDDHHSHTTMDHSCSSSVPCLIHVDHSSTVHIDFLKLSLYVSGYYSESDPRFHKKLDDTRTLIELQLILSVLLGKFIQVECHSNDLSSKDSSVTIKDVRQHLQKLYELFTRIGELLSKLRIDRVRIEDGANEDRADDSDDSPEKKEYKLTLDQLNEQVSSLKTKVSFSVKLPDSLMKKEGILMDLHFRFDCNLDWINVWDLDLTLNGIEQGREDGPGWKQMFVRFELLENFEGHKLEMIAKCKQITGYFAARMKKVVKPKRITLATLNPRKRGGRKKKKKKNDNPDLSSVCLDHKSSFSKSTKKNGLKKQHQTSRKRKRKDIIMNEEDTYTHVGLSNQNNSEEEKEKEQADHPRKVRRIKS